MALRPFLLLLLLLGLVSGIWAQGTGRDLAAFPAQAEMAGGRLGAEYMVKTVTHEQGSFLAPGCLVVETGLAPAKDVELMVNHGHFWLELDGGKRKLMAQPSGMVAAALKYPDWQRTTSLEVAAGVGNGGVVLGRPQTVERFPGDPRPGRQRVPSTQRVPTTDQAAQTREVGRAREEEIVQQAALPEGGARQPVSGYLYFPFDGKPSKLKSVVLVYESPAGKARLKLK